MGLDRVGRTLFRSLVRLARQFDRQPALKALICRNHGPPLPEPLDSLVARFLGGPHLHYYWPTPSSGPGASAAQRLVLEVVRGAFRNPPAGAEIEGAFAGLRYLSSLLAIAQKHGMLAEAAAAAATPSGDQEQQHQQQGPTGASEAASAVAAGAGLPAAAAAVADSSGDGGAPDQHGSLQLAAAPERGLLLLAHPCLGNIFSRSVVLVCRHEMQYGSYGLIINKPLGSSLKHLHERLRQLQVGVSGVGGIAGGGIGGMTGGSGWAGGSAGGWRAAGLGGGGTGGGHGPSAADIPAEGLQQLVDFLTWKHGMHSAAAAAAAARQPDHDEHGNWLGEESHQEGADDTEDDDVDGNEVAGVPAALAGMLGPPIGPGGAPLLTITFEMEPAVRSDGELSSGSDSEVDDNESDDDESDGNFVMDLQSADGDPIAIQAALSEVLRRAGGGTIVMMDTDGQVWGQHMLPGSSSDDSEWEGEGLAGADALMADTPADVAHLLQRCLTRQDRLLLRRQAATAAAEQRQHQHQQRQQEQRQQAAAAAALAAPGVPAQQQQQQQQQHFSGTSSSSDASSSSSASSSSCITGPVSKGDRFKAEVDRLLGEAGAGTAAPPLQHQHQQQQQQHSPMHGASGLFGTTSGRAMGSGGSLGQAATAPSSSSGGDATGANPTVSELMALFNESPLFRGGPVPGVQVLHRRPRLGGEVVLAPHGAPLPRSAPAFDEPLGGATGAAAAAAAEDPALEGGLVVGADLARARSLVESGYLSPSDVRVVMGDCGWAPGQLEAEVARGTWVLARATPEFLDLFGPSAAAASTLPGLPAAAGTTAASSGSGGGTSGTSGVMNGAAVYEEGMWSKCLRALGPDYGELAKVPREVWADLAELEV